MTTIEFPAVKVIEEGKPWQQFTGLKDKNGKEIYEGDILQDYFDDGKKRFDPFLVEWKSGMTECCQSSFDGYETTRFEASKVVGNIYENPNLLKESHEERKEKT